MMRRAARATQRWMCVGFNHVCLLRGPRALAHQSTSAGQLGLGECERQVPLDVRARTYLGVFASLLSLRELRVIALCRLYTSCTRAGYVGARSTERRCELAPAGWSVFVLPV